MPDHLSLPRIVRWAATAVALSIAGTAHAGTVLLVDDDAPPGGDGATWATAYKFLQDAFTAAAGGAVSEIRVGQGIYRPDRDEANPDGTGDQDATYVLVDNLAVRGGYAGFGAVDPDERDVEAFVTLVSGDVLGDDGPNFENYGDNVIRLVTAEGLDETAVLDGFVVRAGTRGLVVGSAPRIVACRFERHAGGAVKESGGASSFTDCSFVGNGGDRGVGLESTGDPGLVDCTFEDNLGTRAGGMYCTGSPHLTRCDFIGNRTTVRGPGALEILNGSPAFVDCVFEANASQKSAGAVQVRGSGASTFSGCTFRANTAPRDGGAFEILGAVSLLGCTFEANVSGVLGGAIARRGDDALVIAGSIFHANEADEGGAIWCSGDDNIIVIDSTFTANEADHGGAIAVDERLAPTITGCTFEANRANMGAGIYNYYSDSEIVECVFRANDAANSGGGVANVFGSEPTITGCLFEVNTAREGAGILNQLESKPLIERSTFTANRAIKGAAIADEGGQTTIIDCTFLRNDATGWGGAVAKSSGVLNIDRCRFLGNSATGLGGAMHNLAGSRPLVTNSVFSGNTATEGGAVRSYDSQEIMINCSFSANDATFGSVISSFEGSDSLLVNCAVWGNGDRAIDGTGDVTFDYCAVEGGQPGNGNIDADPMFVDFDGQDDVAGTLDDDLALAAGSPAIDAGINDGVDKERTLDVDGNGRFVDDPDTPDTGAGEAPIVDIGAYEFQVGCPADLDDSGTVDFGDVVRVLAVWGPCPGCVEDLDDNGVVDFADILVILAAWGPCP